MNTLVSILRQAEIESSPSPDYKHIPGATLDFNFNPYAYGFCLHDTHCPTIERYRYFRDKCRKILGKYLRRLGE